MGSYEQIQDLGVFDRLKLNEKLYVIRKYLKAMPLEGDSAPAIRATKEQIAALQDIYDRMLSLVGRTRETAETAQMHKVEKERNRLVNSVVRRVLALRKSSLEKERLAADELYNAVVDLKGFYRQTRIDKISAAETVQKILAEPQYAEPVRILGLDKYEAELERLAEKAQIPVTTTLLGLSTIATDSPLFKGFVGMHGNVAANVAISSCDLLVAVGMRFDDRVTGDPKCFAPQAKIVHIDIDSSEFGKIIKPTATIHGDARAVLAMLADKVAVSRLDEWLASFDKAWEVELDKVINPELNDTTRITMGRVARKVAEAAGQGAVLVTDVGQNQMLSARYFKYTAPRSIITSGGLGTMGFGLPAAIGAKIGDPSRTVCFFTGDGGLQMTVEELGVILQYGVGVKIILLNNNFLGMVRQWQALFYNRRFSETQLVNPNFVMLANSYGIPGEDVETLDQLDAAVERMLAHDGAYLLNVNIDPEELVYPMTPAGAPITTILLNKNEKYEC